MDGGGGRTSLRWSPSTGARGAAPWHSSRHLCWPQRRCPTPAAGCTCPQAALPPTKLTKVRGAAVSGSGSGGRPAWPAAQLLDVLPNCAVSTLTLLPLAPAPPAGRAAGAGAALLPPPGRRRLPPAGHPHRRRRWRCRQPRGVAGGGQGAAGAAQGRHPAAGGERASTGGGRGGAGAGAGGEGRAHSWQQGQQQQQQARGVTSLRPGLRVSCLQEESGV